ncbi:MAG: crossover junction endodeoxyribonuclease RuvC [Bacteroidales bacterium]|nr:crossover junction endodeoxyribonuclease RuvC [Bacteroidales bacterium]
MEKVILGIDPGTNVMGFGLIQVEGKTLSVLEIGAIELQKIGDPYLKLQKIYKTLTELVEKYAPDEMALEAPFYGKNVQSMLKLGRAQGVAMSVGVAHDMVIHEYAPRKIKLSITGTGAAAKEQVAAILSKMLRYENNQKYLDATDALAVAVCHYYEISKPAIPEPSKTKKVISTKKSSQSWAQFIALHSDRVVKK